MSEKTYNMYDSVYMMNEMNDISAADKVVIEAAKNNARKTVGINVIDFMTENLLEDQSGWGDSSASVIDFGTSISNYKIDTDTHTIIGKSKLRNRLEANSKEFGNYVGGFTDFVDICNKGYDFFTELNNKSNEEEQIEFLQSRDGVKLFNSFFGFSGSLISTFTGSTASGIFFDMCSNVLSKGKENIHIFALTSKRAMRI